MLERHRGRRPAGHGAAADGRGAWQPGRLGPFLSMLSPCSWLLAPGRLAQGLLPPQRACLCCLGGPTPSCAAEAAAGGRTPVCVDTSDRQRVQVGWPQAECFLAPCCAAAAQTRSCSDMQYRTLAAHGPALLASHALRAVHDPTHRVIAAGPCSSSTPTCGWRQTRCRSATPRCVWHARRPRLWVCSLHRMVAETATARAARGARAPAQRSGSRRPAQAASRDAAGSQGLEPALALVGLAGKRLSPGDPDKAAPRPPPIPWWDDLR